MGWGSSDPSKAAQPPAAGRRRCLWRISPYTIVTTRFAQGKLDGAGCILVAYMLFVGR